jgi:hypothetical protein
MPITVKHNYCSLRKQNIDTLPTSYKDMYKKMKLILLQHIKLATDLGAAVCNLFLFPAKPPAAFPADPKAFDFAGAFFVLDPLPLVFSSNCT